MFSDIGPNENQVKAFASRCDKLSTAERDEILRQVPAALAAYGESKVDVLELASIKKYGYNRQEKILTALGKLGPRSKENPQFSVAAQGVTLALAFCECLTAEQFAAWYGAFAET